ncbi:MAG: GTPase Era [Actinomycetes bacterium]
MSDKYADRAPAAKVFRSGFICLVGRPNAGKSTLTNRIVGTKVAITSDRPQTTRRTVRGVLTRQDFQLIVVDTPGLHRPRTLLGERLNDLVRETWTEVDAVGFCAAADEKTGPGDRYLAQQLAQVQRGPVFALITKVDQASPDVIAQRLDSVQTMCADVGLEVAQFVPVSAVDGTNVEVLIDLLAAVMPVGQQLYPSDQLTDESQESMIAELIREVALAGVDDELPHSIAVTIDEMGMRPDRRPDRPLMDIHATIHVERESQKPIIIGKGGSKLRVIGTNARANIEALVGVPVFLDIHVRVAKEWQRDPKQLRRLGF